MIRAGSGVHASRASEALVRLQDKASLPVITTNVGKGALAETHPLSAGPIVSRTGPGSLGLGHAGRESAGCRDRSRRDRPLPLYNASSPRPGARDRT